MTPLDLIGPATALDTGKFKIEYVWHSTNPIKTELKGVQLHPTATFDDIKSPEIICVTGSGNPFEIITDVNALTWLNNTGRNAQYITSVYRVNCPGCS